LDAIRRRQSVIDLVRGEFQELQSLRLSRADRQKIGWLATGALV